MTNFDENKQINDAIEHLKSQMSQELLNDWEDPFCAFEEDLPEEKKFVFQIDKEILPFVENMSLQERNNYVNAALLDKLVKEKKIKRKNELAFYAKHVLVVFLTIILGIPIAFFIVNKSVEMTIKSYNYAQKSFEELYDAQKFKP